MSLIGCLKDSLSSKILNLGQKERSEWRVMGRGFRIQGPYNVNVIKVKGIYSVRNNIRVQKRRRRGRKSLQTGE